MFCPRCGEQNELVQGFCRQCGQALSGVALALERSPEQSLEELRRAQKRINAGSAVMTIFTLIGLANLSLGLFSDGALFAYVALINVLLGLFIGLPLTFAGKVNLKRAARLLARADTTSGQPSLERGQTTDRLLRPGLEADLRIPVPGSVTENTTHNLKESVRGNQLEH